MQMGRGSDGDEDLCKRGLLAENEDLDRDGIMEEICQRCRSC